MEDKTLGQTMDAVFRIFGQHKVENVYLFGSALTGDFASAGDIDLLVNFGEVEPEHYFDNYIDLKMELEQVFNRSVDLVEEKTVKNPVLRRSIDRNKKLIYERTSRKMDV
jgi:predicted nucleotidyltransferase